MSVACLLSSCVTDGFDDSKVWSSIGALQNDVNGLKSDKITTIEEQIKSINETLPKLEAVDAELKNLIKELQAEDADQQTLIEALQTKDTEIEGLITNLRIYVDTELANTKDWATAAFATLEQYKSVVAKLETLKGDIAALETQLGENLTKAISDLETSLKTWVNERLENYYTIEEVDAKIAAVLKRIQSVSYIPKYTDGKAVMNKLVGENAGVAEFDFMVSPKNAVTELAEVWQSAVTMTAVYTQTRAVKFIDLPVVSLAADAANGTITVTASGENLSEEFYNNTANASAVLSISDGNNSINSEYVPMVGQLTKNAVFAHRILLMTFVGTDEPNSPYMTNGLMALAEDVNYNDKYIVTTIHSFGSYDPLNVKVPNYSYLTYWLGISSWPTLVVDCVAGAGASSNAASTAANIKDRIDERLATPATVGISASTIVDDGVITVTAQVKAVKTGHYRIGAWLLEDGLYATQAKVSGLQGNFDIHDNVVHIADSSNSTYDYSGYDLGVIETGQTAEYTFTIDTALVKLELEDPADSTNTITGVNLDNCHVVLFVTYVDNDGNMHIANAIDIPSKTGQTPYEYI